MILNETRTVICQLPCSEIEGNNSWIEEFNEPVFEERVFTLDPEQVEKFDIWRKRKNKKKGEVYVGAIGGAYTFCFTPTGLGAVTIIKCVRWY